MSQISFAPPRWTGGLIGAGATVVIGGMRVRDGLAPKVSEERQQGLQARYAEQYRLYLTQMGWVRRSST